MNERISILTCFSTADTCQKQGLDTLLFERNNETFGIGVKASFLHKCWNWNLFRRKKMVLEAKWISLFLKILDRNPIY